MKKRINFFIISFLFISSLLMAGNNEKLITLPSNITLLNAGSNWLTARDSSGKIGLLSPYGKWLVKPEYDNIEGPVGDIFFGIKAKKPISKSAIINNPFYTSVLYSNIPKNNLTISLTRFNVQGKKMDNLELQDSKYKICPSGILCKLGFPNSKWFFVPAKGNPVNWNLDEEFNEQECNVTGLQNDITLFSQIKSSPIKSVWGNQNLGYRNINFSEIYKTLSGFVVKSWFREQFNNYIIVLDSADEHKFWIGEQIYFSSSPAQNDAVLILGNSSGIYQFTDKTVTLLKDEFYNGQLQKNYGQVTLIARKENNNWFTAVYPQDSLKIPHSSSFLFSYTKSQCINSCFNCKSDTAVLPDFYQSRVRDFIKKHFQDSVFNGWGLIQNSIRPQLVYEENRLLYALDPRGNKYQLPATIKDTIEFLAWLRFIPKPMDEKSIFNYELLWDDPVKSYRGIISIVRDSVMEFFKKINSKDDKDYLTIPKDNFGAMIDFIKTRDNANNSLLTPPKTYVVKSDLIESKFREDKEEYSRLFLYANALYSYTGKKINNLKSIEILLASDSFNLFLQTNDSLGTYLQNGYGQILFKDFKGSLSIRNGLLTLSEPDRKEFVLISKDSGYVKGINFNNIKKAIKENFVSSRDVFFKGMQVSFPYNLYENTDNIFLIDLDEDKRRRGSKHEENYYNYFLSYNCKELVKGPVKSSMMYDGSVKIEWDNKIKILSSEKYYNVIDSFISPGFSRALIYRDKIGYYYHTFQGNKRIQSYLQPYLSFDKKRIYFNQVADDSRLNTIVLDNTGKLTNVGFEISLLTNAEAKQKTNFEIYPSVPKYCKINPASLKPELRGKFNFYDFQNNKIISVNEDSNFKGCYHLPGFLMEMGSDLYLVTHDKNDSSVFDFYLSQVTTSNPCYLLLKVKDLQKIYGKKDDIAKSMEFLISEAYLVNANLEIIKRRELPLVFSYRAYCFSRKPNSGYEISYFNPYSTDDPLNGKKMEDVDSLVQVAFIGDNILITHNGSGYKLFQPGKFIYAFKSLKIPIMNNLFFGTNQNDNTRMVTLSYNFVDEQTSDPLLNNQFKVLPDFKTGLFENHAYIQTLTTASETDSALIGLIKNNNPLYSYNTKNYKYFQERDSDIYNAFNENGFLFNTSSMDRNQVINRLKQAINPEKNTIQFLGMTANGNQISQSIKIPEHYRLSTSRNTPGILKINNETYDFYLPCDSDVNTYVRKEYLYSTLKSQFYAIANNTIASNLLQSPNLLNSNYFSGRIDADNSYLFKESVPVSLEEALGDVASVNHIDDKLIVELYSWSGFIDKNGNQKFPVSCSGGACSSDKIHFKCGKAAIKGEEGKIHYIDTTGQNTFSMQFSCASDFYKGWAIGMLAESYDQHIVFNLGGKKAVIGENLNEYSISGVYLESDANNILAPGNSSLNDKKTALVFDTLGQLKNKFEDFDFYSREDEMISEGLLRLQSWSKLTRGMVGLADLNGNILIEPRYQSLSSFSSGKAAVTDDSSNYYIDRNGKAFFKEKNFTEVKRYSEGKAFVSDTSGWFIIDTLGNRIGIEKFQYLAPFKNELARVKDKDGKLSGFLNSKGKWVIPATYKIADDFSEGLAFVSDTSGNNFFIDENGNRKKNFPVIWKASEFSEGLCHVTMPPSKICLNINSGKITPYDDSSILNQLKPFELEGYSVKFQNDKYAILIKSDYHSNKGDTKIKFF